MFRIWLRRLFQRSSPKTAARRPARRRPSRPRIEMLEDRTLLAAGLVADLNTTIGFSANPSGFATLGNSAYFFANDGVHGVELWKSDGTANNTQLVKDINPGSGSSSLPVSPPPVVVGTALYFFANDGRHGLQLWTSDGTGAGTFALSSGEAGVTNYATQVAAANNLIFFADPATNQLWQTDGVDGTSAHTHAVTDLLGSTINSPFDLTNVGGSLYFSGQKAGGTQAGLWKTDGSAPGTTLVQQIDGSISDLTDVNGTAYFVVAHVVGHGAEDVALWKSTNPLLGASLVKDFGTITPGAPVSVSDLTAFNGKVYFAADDHTGAGAGVELWTSDGTTTQMVSDINSGGASGLTLQPELTSFNGSLYFLANDNSGVTLWQSNGTVGNATQVLDGNSDPISMDAGGGILSVVNNNGNLYFAGANSTGSGLWQTNGPNTVFVQNATVDASAPGLSTGIGDKLFFAASSGTHGTQLWTSQGSVANTGMVTDISPLTSSNPQAITDVGGVAYFVAGDNIHNTGLWKSNGNTTTLVKGGLDFGGSPRLLNVNGILYFFAFDGNPANGTVQLWKSDGTPGNTQMVKGFTPRQTGPFGYLAGVSDTLTNVNGKVYFVADDGEHGLELWKFDPGAGTATMVMDINPGVGGSNPGNLTAVGTNLFFTATDGTNTGLWKTDGTTTTFLQAGASNLVNVDGTLGFTGPDAAHPLNGPALWKTMDGNTITLVKSLGANTSPRLLTNVNGGLAFLVDGPGGVEALWTSNGTDASTFQLRSFPGNQPLSELTALGNTLYFINNSGSSPELWKSNGTVAGTVMVSTLQSAFSPAYFGLANINGTLAFAASDGTHGQELWVSNGGTAGFAQDLTGNALGSFPHDLVTVGGRLFLAANDGIHGTELFADMGSASRTPTATFLGVSASTVPLGTSVIFTAVVRPPHGNVDGGNVTFFLDGQISLATVPVSATGVATTMQTLGAGPHSVVAIYSGDFNFSGSISAPVGVNVVVVPGPTATTTTLQASPTTVVQGQFVNFTATVTAQGGNVSGMVDFMDGATDLGQRPVNPATGMAQLDISTLDLGVHHVIARYLGNGQFAGSVSSSVTVNVTIPNPAVTTTTLGASASSVMEGDSVTLTATVKPGNGNVDGGMVDFMDGATDLGQVPVDPATGLAELSQVLTVGVHHITAVYSGDANFSGSNSTPATQVTVIATGHDTTTNLGANPNPAFVNQPVTLTATVTSTGGDPINGGTVDFMDGTTDLGSVGDPNGDGVFILPHSFTVLGIHHLTAHYSGNDQFGGSTSSDVPLNVQAAGSTHTTLSASDTDVSLGDSVTFTATVKPDAGGNVNAGILVDFMDQTTNTLFGSAPVNASGVAMVSHSFNSVQPHFITAHYRGDVEFASSTSTPLEVDVGSPGQQVNTTTILSASATSLQPGQSVTLTASVIGHTTSGPIPVDGGTVLFQDNGVLFASASLNASTGTAVLTTILGPGNHSITAAYFGDANFNGSLSGPVPITVAAPLPPARGDLTGSLLQIGPPAVHVVRVGGGKVFELTYIFMNVGQLPVEGNLNVVVRGLRSDIKVRGVAGFVGKKKKRSPFVAINLGSTVVQHNGVFTLKLRFNQRPNPIKLSVFANAQPQ